jgi:hypothetical protein
MAMTTEHKPTSAPHDLDTWVWCGHCGAAAWGVPPHGEGNPCPLTVRKVEHDMERGDRSDDAYVAKLEAERAYWEEALDGSSFTDILKRSLR